MPGKAILPGVFSATYSNIPVYEYQFGENNKEHVMRRRSDDWINATHILKAANLDKPGRTRILERNVQNTPRHEKVQGGYGKYQGTWVPLEAGAALAASHGVYEKLRVIFEFEAGNVSPPPAPKHATNKPKVPKVKPAVPKWTVPPPARVQHQQHEEVYEESHPNDEESIPDDTTVASASFMGEDDRYDMSMQNTGPGGARKRKREEDLRANSEQAHLVYGDELLDYFLLTADTSNMVHPEPPEPPPNFAPNFPIDTEKHTGLHWAAAMGDIDIMKQMKRFGGCLHVPNINGETPLMRSVMFTNCLEKQTMPQVVSMLIHTVDSIDFQSATALHHAARVTASRQKHTCIRYYLDVILNKMQELFEPEQTVRIIDAQDANGDTAVHIAARNKARKCVRALIGRGAHTDILNAHNETAEDLIQQLNEYRRNERQPRSSSPFAPDSTRRAAFHGVLATEEMNATSKSTAHHSEAAMTVQSKITPLVLDKFQELARSFDDELIDKEHSEKEAKRILSSTQLELATVREEIHNCMQQDHLRSNGSNGVNGDDDDDARQEAELQELRAHVDSLLEQQQELHLRVSTAEHSAQSSLPNGHGHGHSHGNPSSSSTTTTPLSLSSSSPDDDPSTLQERLVLARLVNEAQQKRRGLVAGYRDALARAGAAGENGELYRRLIARSLDVSDKEIEEMSENLDGLIESLTVEGARAGGMMVGEGEEEEDL